MRPGMGYNVVDKLIEPEIPDELRDFKDEKFKVAFYVGKYCPLCRKMLSCKYCPECGKLAVGPDGVEIAES